MVYHLHVAHANYTQVQPTPPQAPFRKMGPRQYQGAGGFRASKPKIVPQASDLSEVLIVKREPPTQRSRQSNQYSKGLVDSWLKTAEIYEEKIYEDKMYDDDDDDDSTMYAGWMSARTGSPVGLYNPPSRATTPRSK